MTASLTAAKPLGACLRDMARTGPDLTHVLTTASADSIVDGTKAIAHCHHVALDGSCMPRLQDFTDEVANWILEYAIPRRKLNQASSDTPHQRRIKEERLRRTAKESFKKHGMSGEHGEMLLFVLAESLLGLPQLLCKMDLKTDAEMHFHGLDGVHCGPGDSEHQLAVYWCESKVHEDLDGALSQAMDGLKPFLTSAGTGGRDKRRELALLDRYMDLGDAYVQKQLLDCLDPHSTAFNSVSWRGLCLIGFDHDYPSKPNSIPAAEFTADVVSRFGSWKKKIAGRAEYRSLETFEIHFFYIPLGFAEDFRSCMKTSLGL